MSSGTDLVLVEALLDDVLDPTIIRDAVEFAIGVLRGDGAGERREQLSKELGQVLSERRRLMAAIWSGRAVTGLLEAVNALADWQSEIESQLSAIASRRPLQRANAASMREDLIDLSQSWRRVLAEDPAKARPIVTSLVKGRVTITPTKPKHWELRGEGSLIGLFERTVFL